MSFDLSLNKSEQALVYINSFRQCESNIDLNSDLGIPPAKKAIADFGKALTTYSCSDSEVRSTIIFELFLMEVSSSGTIPSLVNKIKKHEPEYTVQYPVNQILETSLKIRRVL